MAAAIWLIAIVLLIVAARRTRRQRRRGGVGSAAAGSIYGWLNEDKRKAVEIVVEGRAEARDPEDRDGNLPDLQTRGGDSARRITAPIANPRSVIPNPFSDLLAALVARRI